jgi:hypothetical protein
LDRIFSPSLDLTALQLHPFLQRVLSSARLDGIKTIADLHCMGAYEFRMLDGVGLRVFREAVELLLSCGVQWSADQRLAKEYTAILELTLSAAPRRA